MGSERGPSLSTLFTGFLWSGSIVTFLIFMGRRTFL
jgi:hypothetical protein